MLSIPELEELQTSLISQLLNVNTVLNNQKAEAKRQADDLKAYNERNKKS
jgi:hypothetical protein